MKKNPNFKSSFANGIFNQIDFVIGTEAANVINVAAQLKDGLQALGQRVHLSYYLSDDANGDGVAGTAPDTSVTIGTDGNIISEITDDKHGVLVTNATGQFDLDIEETGVDTWYLIVCLPDGSIVASTAITFA